MVAFCIIIGFTSKAQTPWTESGNTAPAQNRLGTLNSVPLNFITASQQRMVLSNKGLLGLGVSDPQSTFHIHSELNGLNHNDPIPQNIVSRNFIQITNAETGFGENSGLFIGLQGTTSHFRTSGSMHMKIQNNLSSIDLHKNGRIGFFMNPFSSSDARVNISADASRGLQIKMNSSTLYGLRLNATQSNTNAFEIYSSNGIQTVIKGDGRIGLGTDSPDSNYLLDAAGKIRACEVKVSNPGWCDYVFASDYKLLTLWEIEQFILANHHLPEVPSEAEVEEDGINLAEMNAILLKKIEEMTLHMIAMEKRLADLETK